MPKRPKARFGLTMSPELLEKIEEKRELVPRATFIEHLLKQYFKLQDSMKDELKFYDDLLAMLPDKKVQDKDKLRNVIEAVRTKIFERKKSIVSK